MPSPRQKSLAQLLADGWPEAAETAIEAGWPASTAVWLGPGALAYLAKAGVVIPEPSAPADDVAPEPVPAPPVDWLGPPPVDPDEPPVVYVAAVENDDDNTVADWPAEDVPVPASKPRGRPRKETYR